MSTPKSSRDLVLSLLVLTFVTGVVDAVSFLGLGRVFVANMTGNVVFLGFAAAGEPSLSVVASLTAAAAFLAGALCGGRLVRVRQDRAPLRRATAVQAALLGAAVVLAATLGTGTRLGAELLIVVMGLAMGLQNAAARHLGIPDLTTTVLTMTLTGLAADSKAAGGGGARPLRKVSAVAAMLAGALVGGLLQRNVATWTPLVLAFAIVVAVCGFFTLRREPA
ncbi:MAG TPA: YoaK family protein [Amycolatopsis sp.]|nr:YoaK family protein [Amycolatopsis sp.]